jgi:hypothetical protein
VGARTLRIFGLDTNYDPQKETVTLNGASDVTTVGQYLRIHRMKVLTAGTDVHNVGWLTATASTDNTITSLVRPQINQTEQSIYTIPRNTVGTFNAYGGSTVNTGGAATTEIQLWVRPLSQVWQLTHITGEYSQGSGHFMHHFDPPLVLPPRTDVKLRGSTTRDGTKFYGHFGLITAGVETGEVE